MAEVTETGARPAHTTPSSHLVDERHLGWLAVTRLLYAAGMLLWWRPLDISSLADVPVDLWFAPLGPFAMLDGPPPAWFFHALRATTLALLLLLLVGWRTRSVGIALSAAFVVAAGLRFSTGKVDHDLVLWLLPALLGSAWGCRLAVRPEPSGTPRLGMVAVALGVTFLTSGLSKALSGWLAPSASSVEGWAQGYIDVYGWNDPVAERVVQWPLPWELFDVATVLVECGLLFLLVRRRTTPLAVMVAATFNLGVLFVMAIDFSQLVLVYLPLLPVALRVPRRVSGGAMLVAGSATLAAMWMFPPAYEVTWRPVVAVAALGSAALLGAATLCSAGSGYVVRPRRALGWTLALLATYPLVVIGAEPFPAVTGPMFWGDGPEMRQVWRKDGELVSAAEALDVDAAWATNIAHAGWPSDERGHELQRLWYHPRPGLPGVTVEWIRSR